MCRYAVSVVWRLGSDYEVKDVWYGRTVIRSAYKLTYEVRGKCSVSRPLQGLSLAVQIGMW